MDDGTKDKDPLNILISKMLSDIIGPKVDQMKTNDLTLGEQLVGYDPNKGYLHVESETLQNAADTIDVLKAQCTDEGSQAWLTANQAITYIQTANFWTQKALALSKV